MKFNSDLIQSKAHSLYLPELGYLEVFELHDG